MRQVSKILGLVSDFNWVIVIKLKILNVLIRATKSKVKQLNIIKHSLVLKILKKELGEFLILYNNNIIENKKIVEENNVIWNFWWQGRENCPKIVESCLKSHEKWCPNNVKVITIDKENLHHYIELPEYIYEKLESKKMSITSFSDLVRLKLLGDYGGCWLDATCYVNNDISYIFENEFWSIKHGRSNQNVAKGRWTAYALAAHKGNIVCTLAFRLLCEYWKKKNIIIDYFLIDYCIELLYRNVDEVKNLIDNIKQSNTNDEKLIGYLDNQYDEILMNQIMQDTQIFKVTWKREYANNSEITFYKKLFDFYGRC